MCLRNHRLQTFAVSVSQVQPSAQGPVIPRGASQQNAVLLCDVLKQEGLASTVLQLPKPQRQSHGILRPESSRRLRVALPGIQLLTMAGETQHVQGLMMVFNCTQQIGGSCGPASPSCSRSKCFH